jgi:rubrerythrin
MALKKMNGELATELKELDVDRVDGVDRPATGRPFMLFKSAGQTTRKQRSDIIRVAAGVLKSCADQLAGLRNGTLVVNKGVSRDGYMAALADVRKDALRVMTLAKADEMRFECPECGALTDDPSMDECPECALPMEQATKAKRPDPYAYGASNGLPEPPAPGVSQPLDDEPSDHLGNKRPASGGRMDNKKLYGRTPQEMAKRRAKLF